MDYSRDIYMGNCYVCNKEDLSGVDPSEFAFITKNNYSAKKYETSATSKIKHVYLNPSSKDYNDIYERSTKNSMSGTSILRMVVGNTVAGFFYDENQYLKITVYDTKGTYDVKFPLFTETYKCNKQPSTPRWDFYCNSKRTNTSICNTYDVNVDTFVEDTSYITRVTASNSDYYLEMKIVDGIERRR